MLGPVDLLEAQDFLLDVLVEVLLNHGWLEVDCFLKGEILPAWYHKDSTLELRV